MADADLTPDQKAERDKHVKAGYQHAQRALRDKYRDEFNELQKAYLADLGIDWSPAPTASEKKRKELAALLKDNPDLKAELIAELTGAQQAG